ncbi:MAG TPA: SDR family oxidoreductase [Acidimicrobiales bacterium]|nr:SDR family oxidoreductase [Acidimicrobiales bacterium]
MPDHRFDGKVAIVTGAASGIGKALSNALARRGATVVLADLDEPGAKAAADSIGAGPPGRASGVALDVTDAGAFADLVDAVVSEHGHVDLLFNNAGIGVSGEVADLSLEHWQRVIDVNLRGVVHGVAAAYPAMIRQGRGHIVNTASLAGLIPAPLLTPYAMTKHGVVGLSTSLRAEAKKYGVRVSVVCPGVIDTPLLDKPNPPDLPPVTTAPDGRALLSRTIGRAYPPQSLAENVLEGVARNRPFIVTPRHARTPWRIYRLWPRLVVDSAPWLLRRVLQERGTASTSR